MKEEMNIDELLNSFLDGEATERERIEVQRLLTHDAEVAKRLRELEKCRLLVGSLPYAEAPAEILEKIKASVGNVPVKAAEREVFKHHKGARHLLIRQMLSVAAIVALVAVLGIVIYTIVGPESSRKQPIAAEDLKLPVKKVVVEPQRAVQPVVAKAEKPIEGAKEVLSEGFSGRLELKTKTLATVDTFISKAIEDSGLTQYSLSKRDGGERVHTVVGNRESVNLLLSDLDSVWGKFDSAALVVEAGRAGEKVVVDNVKAGQIAEILKQDNSEARIRVAKDIASFNRIEKQLPSKEMFAAIGYRRGDLITIPKPVLTSGERPITKAAGGTEAKQQMNLTIVVTSSE
jgi:negative regulator of sigma E activity